MPRRRRPGPVVTEGVEALLLRGEELAKGWLVALVEDAPLEAAAAIMAGDLARDGPRICEAVVRAIYDEADLRRLEPNGVLEPFVSRAGELAGARSAEADAHAIETLRSVIWSALRAELVRTEPETLAEVGERLSLVSAVVRAAVLRRRAEGAGVDDPPRRVSPLRVARTEIRGPGSPGGRRASDPPERRGAGSSAPGHVVTTEPGAGAGEAAVGRVEDSGAAEGADTGEAAVGGVEDGEATGGADTGEAEGSDAGEAVRADVDEEGRGAANEVVPADAGGVVPADAGGVVRGDTGEAMRGDADEAVRAGAGATITGPADVRGPTVGDALWIGALRDEIARAARASSPLSLLLVELEEADRLLAVEPRGEASATFGRFAQSVRTALRHHDVLACETESRAWIIARDTGRTGAQALGSRIVTAVPAQSSWRGAPLTVSVGLAVLGEDGHNAAALIDAAEQMRFAAEASGIGIVGREAGDEEGDGDGEGNGNGNGGGGGGGDAEPPAPGPSLAS